jgi:hypothetical protein
MKSVFLIFIAVIFCTRTADAQSNNGNTPAGPQPQYLNNVYLLKKDSLVSLEKTQAELKNKTKALGFGGNETAYVMDGGSSPFRIKMADDMRFMVKMNSSMMDPTAMIKLYRFDSGKSEREAVMGGGGGMFNKKKNVGSGVEVQCNIQKSGSDIFTITPGTKLAPGEYGFLNMMMMTANGSKPRYTIFAFGVDQ